MDDFETKGYPRPSVRTLLTTFPHLIRRQAEEIRAAMLLDQGPALDLIDSILETHGVEYISRGHNRRSPAFFYCNAGDPYKPTIMHIRGRFVVGCWGDIVERGHYD